VRAGDLLVRFEIPNLPAEVEKQSAEVQRADSAVATARANQTRVRDLFERGIAARKEVEDADRELADAQAALAQAQASRGAAGTNASRAVVRASFSGVIAKRYHNPGDFVEPGASDPVLRVIDLDRLEVVASVPLADAPRITVGASARITGIDDGPSLKVLSRPAAVEEGTASVPVRLAFTSPAHYPARAPVAIDIDAERHDGVIVVPQSAIVREGEQTAVFVVTGNKAQRRPVATGLSGADLVEIKSGLKAGEMVIVDGQNGLPDGATVTTAPDTTSDDKTPGAAAPSSDGKTPASAGKDAK
jgi:RND family efflux transporter MFP subunit